MRTLHLLVLTCVLGSTFAAPAHNEAWRSVPSFIEAATENEDRRVLHSFIEAVNEASATDFLFIGVSPVSEAAASPGERGVVPRWVALSFSGLVFAGIAMAYRSHGAVGVLHMMVYISSVIGCQLTMKYVLTAFPHPLLMSFVHFSLTLCVVLGWKWWSTPQGERSRAPSYSPYWYTTRIAPIAISLFGTVAANNASLLYIGAALNSILGILTPVITAVLAAAFGLRITFWAWVGITIALLGDAILTCDVISSLSKGGSAFWSFITGICFSFAAMGFRAFKTVLQDAVMNSTYKFDEEEPKVDPAELWALQGPMVVFLALICTVTWDGLGPMLALLELDWAVLGMVGLSCICAVYVNIGGMHMIKMLGAPASQIAGKLNILVTTALASAFMGERLTTFEICGASVILLGATIFERSQHSDKQTETNEAKLPLQSNAGKLQV